MGCLWQVERRAMLFVAEPAPHPETFENLREDIAIGYLEFKLFSYFMAIVVLGVAGRRRGCGYGAFEGQQDALSRRFARFFRLAFGRLRANSEELPVFGKRTVRRVENNVPLMHAARSFAYQADAKALECGPQGVWVVDLELDFDFLRHLH